jgi:PAS domain S-box-containing protein
MPLEGFEDLLERNRELQSRLEDAEETLRALRSGEVDAVVASGPDGDRVYTLKGADEAYRVMVQNMAEGALTLTREGLILFSNQQFASMLGFPLERVIGSPIHELVADGDAPAVNALVTGSAGPTTEVALRKADSALVPVRLSASALRLDEAECVCLIVTDLTEQQRIREIQRAEELSRESEARLRALGDNLPEGAIYRYREDLDGTRQFEFVSAGFERLTGVPAAEILRDSAAVFGLIVPEDTELHRSAVARSREHLARFEIELRHRHRITGELRWTLLRSMPSRLPDGSTVWEGIQLDVTEQKRAAEQLRIREDQVRQAQKMESIGVLAGGIAHDFNNLLTGILGNASLLLDSIPASDPNRSSIEDLVVSATRAADLTRQLLAYAGKGRFIVRPINISETVHQVSNLVRSSVPAIIGIDFDLDEGIPSAEADAGQIQQILMNLVLNASEAIGEQSGRITIRTRARSVDAAAIEESRLDIPEGAYVSLEVQDTGPGMDDATRAKVFEPFFTTKFTGRGLGLAAVHGIVRAHKGAAMVDSRPGNGARFTVLLPAASAIAPPKPEPARGVQNLSAAGTVLVVDDEAAVRSVVKVTLQRLGYRVLLARNGIEAIETFQQAPHQIAVVLLDLTMPMMTGEETLHRLRAIRPDIPVLLSSGYSQVEVVQRFTGQGLAGFISKPFSPATLVAKIRSACAGSLDAACQHADPGPPPRLGGG